VISPEKPINEDSRLKTLRSLHILDTPPEERFDRLTRMAKRLFDVPIALVSLVDENRQWFKSCIGLDATETPRDISFCGHAILDEGIFIIPDTLQDARFSDNPLVTGEPHIRFYAGCPLRYVDGSQLGTLCIVDRTPRNLDDEDLEALKDLAATAERELAAILMATLDDLTGVNNRRGFLLLAEQELKLCDRLGLPASLLFLDLNDFKSINDTFGHAEGDRALVTFASQVKQVCRTSDVIARLGGDEFVILLIKSSRSHAKEITSRLQRNIHRQNTASGKGYNISFSCGVVGFDPQKHHSIDELLEQGDAVMYENKRATRLNKKRVD
jgi:diguanylate cyclase (GGDEF)-like protein